MIKLKNVSDEKFRIIMETLSRIGVFAKKRKLLLQKAFIIKSNTYTYLVHHKEIKGLNFDSYDESVLNTIATLLLKWKLINIYTPLHDTPTIPSITVLSKKNKNNMCVTATNVTLDNIKSFINSNL